MGEVDTGRSIKQVYTHLYMNEPLLKHLKIFDADAFLDFVRAHRGTGSLNASGPGISLESILREAFDVIQDPKKVRIAKRMEPYRLHTELLLDELSKPGDENLLSGRVPIFVGGMCIQSPSDPRKKSHDPYSNLHYFSTILVNSLSAFFPPEFLKLFYYQYLQPVSFFQGHIARDEELGLRDIFADSIEERVNVPLHADGKLGFGTLEKFDDITGTVGNSRFSPAMFDVSYIDQLLISNRTLVMEQAEIDGVVDLKSYRLKKMYEAFINRQIMAIKYAHFFRLMVENAGTVNALKGFDIKGVPVYAEKGSFGVTILKDARKYNRMLRLAYVGGEQGMLGSTPDTMPFEGICHTTAFGRLLGLLQNCYMQWKDDYRAVRIKPEIERGAPLINFVSTGRDYPWLLLEENVVGKKPKVHDLLMHALNDPNIPDVTEQGVKDIDEMANGLLLGFCRVEPILVDYETSEDVCYEGPRSMSKVNTRKLAEFADKPVVFPDEIVLTDARGNIKTFFDMPQIPSEDIPLVSDFRGSELSLPTSPHLTWNWVKNAESGNVDTGCPIARMIGGIDRNKKLELILEALEVFPDEQEEYWEFHDEKGESKFTRRGTAIHYLGSGWIDGLVHAETLAKGGFEPRPSTAYTETPFFERFVFPSSEGPIPFTSSMHPDLYYFRKRGDNEFDMVIMDTKSNRVTEYPEHKYLLQTLYYGIFISSIMEKNLGSKIHNIYVVFNKNAFHLGFGGRIDNVIPHHYFRAQKRSRTTKFGPDHPIRLLVPHLVGEIMLEKQLMKEEKGYFFHSRREQNKKHRCKKCFQEQRLLCRYLSREFLLGEDVREYFGKIS